MSANNNPPFQIQKQLRKDVLYGCAICGCPILEYVHIVPYTDVQAFLPENMIALCPLHHIFLASLRPRGCFDASPLQHERGLARLLLP